MRIIITGHKGAIGSRLMKQLPTAMGIDTSEGDNLVDCPLPDADVIYHLAAHPHVEESWDRPVYYMENLVTTVRLVKEYPKATIIYANSASAIDPESPYGFSKKVAGEYLKTFHPYYIGLMFPNVYDTGRSVVDYFKERDTLTVFGEGDAIRDYVHIDDIVDGLIKAQKWAFGEYQMGGGCIHTVKELAESTGKPITYEAPRKEAHESVIPNTTPNWKPTINVTKHLND